MQTILYFGSKKRQAIESVAKKNPICEDRVGGDKGTRSTDSRIFSPMLYQLSYITILLSVANVEK